MRKSLFSFLCLVGIVFLSIPIGSSNTAADVLGLKNTMDPVEGECITGYIFVDENGNSQKDPGECWMGIFLKEGNVGIETTDPDTKLEISGTAGTDGIKFPDGTVQTTAATGGTATGGAFAYKISSNGTWTTSTSYVNGSDACCSVSLSLPEGTSGNVLVQFSGGFMSLVPLGAPSNEYVHLSMQHNTDGNVGALFSNNTGRVIAGTIQYVFTGLQPGNHTFYVMLRTTNPSWDAFINNTPYKTVMTAQEMP